MRVRSPDSLMAAALAAASVLRQPEVALQAESARKSH